MERRDHRRDLRVVLVVGGVREGVAAGPEGAVGGGGRELVRRVGDHFLRRVRRQLGADRWRWRQRRQVVECFRVGAGRRVRGLRLRAGREAERGAGPHPLVACAVPCLPLVHCCPP
ncbi:hypothetical protein [Dactylosporangium sp. NPDC050588]|uniref:hypothetical protein n=1 Tax=Dactylosporangium sp. NPDC050588 TaxID=3157211 RepID=UPI0033F756E1